MDEWLRNKKEDKFEKVAMNHTLQYNVNLQSLN